jgi:predicted P-loop ATPase
VIVDLAECAAMRRAEITALKAYVTRTHSDFVDKYERLAVKIPRRVVFAGTTNETEFLSDPTGARRWWVVLCGTHHGGRAMDLPALRVDRGQLWAEAVALYRAWEARGSNPDECPWWATREELPLAEAAAEEARQLDPWEESINKALCEGCSSVGGFRTSDVPAIDEGAASVTAAQIWTHVLRLDSPTRADSMRLTQAMRALGWRAGRAGHGNVRTFTRP